MEDLDGFLPPPVHNGARPGEDDWKHALVGEEVEGEAPATSATVTSSRYSTVSFNDEERTLVEVKEELKVGRTNYRALHPTKSILARREVLNRLKRLQTVLITVDISCRTSSGGSTSSKPFLW